MGGRKMQENNSIKSINDSIQAAMELPKCRKCGCMKESLKTIKNELLKVESNDASKLLNQVKSSIEKMEPIKYT